MRPTLPPLLWVAVAAWVGAVCAERMTCQPTLALAVRSPVLIGVFVVAMVVLAAVLRSRATILALVVLALGAGIVSGGLYWTHRDSDAQNLASAGSKTWTVEVLTDSTQGRFSTSSRARIVSPVGNGATVTVEWPAESGPVPEIGMFAEVTGSVSLPGDGEYAARARRAGICGTLKAKSVLGKGWAKSARGAMGPLRVWCSRQIAAISGDGGALLDGVVLGDRRRLEGTAAETDFKTTGLTHLVAVSGSHLVVVAALFGSVLSALHVPRVPRTIAIAALTGAYVAFSGVQASALRAWVMALAVSAAGVSGRRSDGSATLAGAAAAMILLMPATAFDLGFQLSVAAVTGLVVFGRFTETWLAMALPRCPEPIVAALALTLAATVSTVPLTTPIFGMLSLVSPLANLLVGPIVSALIVVGFAGLAASAIWQSLGSLVLHCAGACGACAASVAGYLASWPRAAVPLQVPAITTAVIVAAGAALWALWPTPTRTRARCLTAALVIGVLLIAWAPQVGGGPELVVLDIGQGDALLLRDGSHSVLVDTGPSESALRSALAREGVRQLDAVVITHLHDDHYGGLAALKGLVGVKVVAFRAGALDEDCPAIETAEDVSESPLRELKAGDRLNVGRFTLDVLWPRSPVDEMDENAASIVLLVKCGDDTALLTGDAEANVLHAIEEEQSIGDIDIYKVGHHGSADAIDPELMQELKPELAVISVGTGNRFGHPTRATLSVLEDGHAAIARTDESGDLTVRFSEKGIYLETSGRHTSAARPSAGQAPFVCATLSGVPEPGGSGYVAKESNVAGFVGSQICVSDSWERAPPA